MAKVGRKHSDLEREERIIFILNCRSKGVKATGDLLRFFTEKYPSLSKSQFEKDLKEAKDKIKEYYENDAQFEISEIVKHYWELYNKSLKLQDYRECRGILKEISSIKGLVVQKIESNNKNTHTIEVTHQEVVTTIEDETSDPLE